MGVILNGILGPVRGKVGPVQGATWKGIPYLKQYTIPSNPNTPSQQAQRGRFAAAVLLAQTVYSLIVESWWNPFAVKQSGYNAFLGANIATLGADPYPVTTSNLLSSGNVESVNTVAATLSGNTVTVGWSATVSGNGLATDNVRCYVLNKDTYAIYASDDAVARSVETDDVDCDSEADPTKLIAFAVVYRGSGVTLEVGTSASDQVEAA